MSSAQKYRVIIAHSDPAEQRRISSILEKTKLFQVVFVTHSGEACIRRAVQNQPHLVVADALLSGVDGLEVLQHVKLRCPNTRVLFLTSYHTLMRHRAVSELADYCILTPYSPEVLAARAMEMVQTQPEGLFPERMVSSQTAAELAVLSAPMRLKGYAYVSDGIRLSVLNPEVIHHHVGPNGLYAQLCRRHNECYRNVERCMRTVSDYIFEHAALHTLEQYFTPADLARGRITNLTLISALAAHITETLRKAQASQDFQR